MMADPGSSEQRVLILAPTGRDAALIGRLLAENRMIAHPCRSLEELARELGAGAGTAVIAEEGLSELWLGPLQRELLRQPAWSDIPLLLLTAAGRETTAAYDRLISLFNGELNVTILERPLRIPTLLSTVRTALRARLRQYQVRNFLEERKRNEDRLLQTQKLESLGVLAGGVAHDFNNLLTGILGSATLALESLPPGMADTRAFMKNVIEASERAAHLTKQLLAYAGKGRFVVEPIDISETVREISHLVQSSLPKNVQLRLDLADRISCIEADVAQIQQIILNLVINAAEAISDGNLGTVRVITRDQPVDEAYIRQTLSPGEINTGPYVTLEVHDTGIGMDEETIARIFDPFFTTKFTGRGLGLAAVVGIVRSHKGALRVYSTPGKGSTFKLLFPATDAQPRRKTEHRPPALDQSLTVLVIDDEEVVRRTAKAALERRGWQVVIAKSGPEGIELFKSSPDRISVVLLDLTMPAMSGEEVLELLQQVRGEVKVILSSGYNEAEIIRRFTGKRLAGFLQKPYTSAALISKVVTVMKS